MWTPWCPTCPRRACCARPTGSRTKIWPWASPRRNMAQSSLDHCFISSFEAGLQRFPLSVGGSSTDRILKLRMLPKLRHRALHDEEVRQESLHERGSIKRTALVQALSLSLRHVASTLI